MSKYLFAEKQSHYTYHVKYIYNDEYAGAIIMRREEEWTFFPIQDGSSYPDYILEDLATLVRDIAKLRKKRKRKAWL